MRAIVGVGCLIVALLCVVFAYVVGANLFDSYDEEIEDWVFVVVAGVSLVVGALVGSAGMASIRSRPR
jgi:hypothetical protein